MKQAIKLNMMVAMMLVFSACSTLTAPVDTAQSPEQKAFALYGTFVNIQEVAARYIQSDGVTESEKNLIKSADALAHPLAEVLRETAYAYRDAKGGSGEVQAHQDLENAFADASHAVHDMINLVIKLVEGN